MQENTNQESTIGGTITKIGIGLIIGYLMWGNQTYEGETAEYWYNMYAEEESSRADLRDRLAEYQYALEEANNTITAHNDQISTVQMYTWDDYEAMGDAIDSLEEFSLVDEP